MDGLVVKLQLFCSERGKRVKAPAKCVSFPVAMGLFALSS